jgi:hypothetical protein
MWQVKPQGEMDPYGVFLLHFPQREGRTVFTELGCFCHEISQKQEVRLFPRSRAPSGAHRGEFLHLGSIEL